MSEPFVGEIRMFAGQFAPRGWAFCDGQLLAISQNDALFSLLGTIYGGDGRTTFGLPEMRGRIPIHAGSGPGLSPRKLGAKSGAENVTITTPQVPSHSHGFQGVSDTADTKDPAGAFLATLSTEDIYRVDMGATAVSMNSGAIGAHSGGSRSHSNLMPALAINFIIALVGIYPSKH